MRSVAIVLTTSAILTLGAQARGQDFPPTAPGGGPRSSSEFLDLGLPAAPSSWELAAASVRRFGLAELETRSLSAGAAWASLRAAAGVSQTGGPDLGWWSYGAAAGFATPNAGAGVRAVGREDRSGPRDRAAFEAGGGAWVAAARGITVWIAHPQGVRRGAPPPRLRGLETGARWVGSGGEAWLARESSAEGGSTDRHRAGGALVVGPARIAVELSERPLRVSLGVSVRRGGLGASAAVDQHPILPGTTRLGVVFGSPP